jgi:zinc resistance-associated protein
MTKGSLERFFTVKQSWGEIAAAPRKVRRFTPRSKWSAPMKPGLSAALTMAAVLGSAIAFSTLGGRADPGTPPPMQEKHQFSDADRAAFLDARIAAIHAGLKLSPDQEKLWPGVETALRTAAKGAMERHQKFKSERAGENLIDRIRQRGENAVAHGHDLATVADAAAPLYGTLSEEQKHRLPVLMHILRPHFFHRHFAMMGGGHEN